MRLFCVKCNKDVEAHLIKGTEVYPHRVDLAKKNFYKCPHCGNWVGCHDKTTRPLGCIPTPELKIARMKLHDKMDPIWKSGKMTRSALYRLISKRIGSTFHNGTTKSVTECLAVWDVVDQIEKDIK